MKKRIAKIVFRILCTDLLAGYLFTCQSESSFPVLKIGDGFKEVFLSEVGP
jgi:hypothetical protein